MPASVCSLFDTVPNWGFFPPEENNMVITVYQRSLACSSAFFDYLLGVDLIHMLLWLWLLSPPPLPASWGKSSISHLLKWVNAKMMLWVCAGCLLLLFCFSFPSTKTPNLRKSLARHLEKLVQAQIVRRKSGRQVHIKHVLGLSNSWKNQKNCSFSLGTFYRKTLCFRFHWQKRTKYIGHRCHRARALEISQHE